MRRSIKKYLSTAAPKLSSTGSVYILTLIGVVAVNTAALYGIKLLRMRADEIRINNHQQAASINRRADKSGNKETASRELQISPLLSESVSRIGLALGCGAAKGLAHIGVLKALEEAGIQIDYIAGSSMGALVGAAYAAGIPVDSMEQVALQTDWKDLALMIDPALAKPGFIDGDRIERFLTDKFYRELKIEDLPTPFAVTAADISTGQQYIIDRGSLATAVRTSISIPVIFTPQKYEYMYLVDGGLVDPVPIDVVRAMGADFIIAVNVLVPPGRAWEANEKNVLNADEINPCKDETWFHIWKTEESKRKRNLRPSLPRIIQRTVMISQAKIAQFQIDLSNPDILIEPDTRDISTWGFRQVREAIDLGYIAAIEAFDEYKRNRE